MKTESQTFLENSEVEIFWASRPKKPICLPKYCGGEQHISGQSIDVNVNSIDFRWNYDLNCRLNYQFLHQSFLPMLYGWIVKPGNDGLETHGMIEGLTTGPEKRLLFIERFKWSNDIEDVKTRWVWLVTWKGNWWVQKKNLNQELSYLSFYGKGTNTVT